MAQQAATASAACGGRFRLGVGASHEPVMGMYGIEFDRPIGHLREYLDIVHALLADGKVAARGRPLPRERRSSTSPTRRRRRCCSACCASSRPGSRAATPTAR